MAYLVKVLKDNNDPVDDKCFKTSSTEILKVVNNTNSIISIFNIKSEHVKVSTIDGKDIIYDYLQVVPNGYYRFLITSIGTSEYREPFNIEVQWV